MTRRIASCGAKAWMLAVVAGASACKLDVITSIEPPPASWDPTNNTHPDSAQFRELLTRYVRQGLPGAVLLVRTPRGQWNGAAGYARVESDEPMLPTHLFHAASVTKMYMAAAVLLLVEDGTIDLDAKISTYLPEEVYRRIPNGTSATVRELLGHRSGIPDFSGDMAYDLDFLNDPLGAYSAGRLLSYLDGQSALSAPGEGYFYSNADYYILALIVDRLVQGGHASVIATRILQPLGLHDTYYKEGQAYPTPAGLVNSYQDVAGDGRLMNVTDLMIHNDRVFMGNAGLIASSADLADFLDALVGGQVVSPQSLAEMEAWSEPHRHGLGLSYLDTSYGPAIGHSGGDIGALAQVRYFPDKDATLVLLTNGGDSGVTDRLFGELWAEAMDLALGGP